MKAFTLSTGIITASLVCVSYACPFPNYNVGNDCCNMFGKDCAGPCWNWGCKTECQKGTYPGNTVSCPTSDNKIYFCCPTGSNCKSSCTKESGCCCDPNKKEIIEISSVKYDLNKISAALDPLTANIKLSNFGTNLGSRETAAPTLKVTLTSSQSSTYSFTSQTKISASAKVKAGIPFFGTGEVSFGVEQTFAVSESQTRTLGVALEINTGQDYLLPYSRQVWEFNSDMMQMAIPFTAIATVQDDCGTKSTMQITGSTSVKGVAAVFQGKYTKIAGPSVPVECISPFNTPVEQQFSVKWCPDGTSEMCEDHPICKRLGFQGICCKPGSLEGCCSVAAAHQPTCDKYNPDRAVCPGETGAFDKCCQGGAKLGSVQKTITENATWEVKVHVPDLDVPQPNPVKAPESSQANDFSAFAIPVRGPNKALRT